MDGCARYAGGTEITRLFGHPHHVDQVAALNHAEFWTDQNIHTHESLAALLRQAATPDASPLSRIALVDGAPVGTVKLVENDDEKRIRLRPWLAALVVDPEHRHRGIGSALVRDLQQFAANLGIDTLCLGTDNPGFYARLGAQVHEHVNDDFAIMQLQTQRL